MRDQRLNRCGKPETLIPTGAFQIPELYFHVTFDVAISRDFLLTDATSKSCGDVCHSVNVHHQVECRFDDVLHLSSALYFIPPNVFAQSSRSATNPPLPLNHLRVLPRHHRHRHYPFHVSIHWKSEQRIYERIHLPNKSIQQIHWVCILAMKHSIHRTTLQWITAVSSLKSTSRMKHGDVSMLTTPMRFSCIRD
jgi:hypothetical protein